MLMPQVNIQDYRCVSDFWVSLEHLMSAKTREFTYWGNIDTLSHRFGPGDERVRLEFATFFRYTERF